MKSKLLKLTKYKVKETKSVRLKICLRQNSSKMMLTHVKLRSLMRLRLKHNKS